jgi:4-hydroxy-tetrahydrodipicolinate synthase
MHSRSAHETTFSGVWTAVVTPFKDDFSIDWPAWEKLLEHQAKGGVSGIVVSGTTGESPTLSVQEKISLVRKARAVLPKDIRVMAGSGGNNTEQSIELSRLCVDAGADSLLVVTPPYNKPSPDGLKLHFSMMTSAVKVPVCLYHVPGRTGQLLNPEVMSTLCGIPGIHAVKEASGDLALFSRAVIKTRAYGTAFLSGDDITFLPSLAVGGCGVISVLSNILPGEVVGIWQDWMAGRAHAALEKHERLQPLMDALFCESNPGPVKELLSQRGFMSRTLRPPLAPVTNASARLVADSFKASMAG